MQGWGEAVRHAAKIDPQTAYAYSSLVKLATGLSERHEPADAPVDPAAWKREAEQILEQEYGIKMSDDDGRDALGD